MAETKNDTESKQGGQWYRVCLNTIVRKGRELDSERLRILPMGSRVRVVHQVERRVRIDMPVAGWCSIRSSNGDTILSPIEPNDRNVGMTPRSSQNQDPKSLKQTLEKKQQKGEQTAKTVASKLDANLDKLGSQLTKSDKSKLEQARMEMQRTKAQLQKLKKEDITNTPEYRAAQQKLEDQQKEFHNFLEGVQESLHDMGADTGNVQEVLKTQNALESLEQSLQTSHKRMLELQTILDIQQEMLAVSNASSVGADENMENSGFQNGDVIKIGDNCYIVRAIFKDSNGEFRVAAEAGGDGEGDSNGEFEGRQIIKVDGTNRAVFPLLSETKRLTSGSLLMMLIGVMNQIETMNTAKG